MFYTGGGVSTKTTHQRCNKISLRVLYIVKDISVIAIIVKPININKENNKRIKKVPIPYTKESNLFILTILYLTKHFTYFTATISTIAFTSFSILNHPFSWAFSFNNFVINTLLALCTEPIKKEINITLLKN